MDARCTYCGFKQRIDHKGIVDCENCGMRFPSSPKYESAVIRNRRNLHWDGIDGITIDEMEAYGYVWDKMVPLTPETACELLDDIDVYRLFRDGNEVVVERVDDSWDDFIYGIDVDDVQYVVDRIRRM